MELVLIRHGEPDRSMLENRGFVGHGYDLVPLTPRGVEQARRAAANPLLEGAQLLVTSPYTRAMQTAAEICRITGLEMRVELDLRELEKDLTGRCDSLREIERLHQDFLACHGEYPPGETRKWETVSQLSARVCPVLDRYAHYDKIVVVTHGGVIRRFIKQIKIEYAQPYLVQVTSPVQCYGWV